MKRASPASHLDSSTAAASSMYPSTTAHGGGGYSSSSGSKWSSTTLAMIGLALIGVLGIGAYYSSRSSGVASVGVSEPSVVDSLQDQHVAELLATKPVTSQDSEAESEFTVNSVADDAAAVDSRGSTDDSSDVIPIAGPVGQVPLRDQDEHQRQHLKTVPIQIWSYYSHCGGAKLPNAKEAALRHGSPAVGQRIYIRRGDTNQDNGPVLMSLVADADGFIHVPFIHSKIATLRTPTPPGSSSNSAHPPLFPDIVAALPSNHQTSVYCLVDLEGNQKTQELITSEKATPSQYLQIDYDCMDKKLHRCQHVLNLAHPESLTFVQPKQRFVPRPAPPNTKTHPLITTQPVAVIEIRHPCLGRGECEKWTGPLPK